jgi:hypothetical protein
MAFFCDGDFRWNHYYFRHAVLLVEFVLGYVVSRALVHPARSVVITEVVLGVYLFALVTVRPYAATKSWKFPVHVCVVVVAMLIAALNYVLFAGDEEGRSSVSSAARGLEWLVFGLVIALFLLLLVRGWWYLVTGADRHAADLQEVGMKTGSNRTVFGSIRWRLNPMKPKARLRKSLRAVAAAVRMRMSPGSIARAQGASPGAAAGTAHGIGPGDVPVGLDGDIEMTATRGQTSPRNAAIVRIGDGEALRVPSTTPPSAKSADSPTARVHQFMFAAARNAPARLRIDASADARAGFGPHHTRSGAYAGTPLSPAASPRRRSSVGVRAGAAAEAAPGGAPAHGPSSASVSEGRTAVRPQRGGRGRASIAARRNVGVGALSLGSDGDADAAEAPDAEGAGALPATPGLRASFAAVAPRH